LDELTHQQESIDHSNTIHEEPHANSAFINLPPTSNTIKGENITGLIKIEPSPKVSLFEKHNVGLSFSRQLFDKLSGSFEVSPWVKCCKAMCIIIKNKLNNFSNMTGIGKLVAIRIANPLVALLTPCL
jgi:hypothetical protein